MRICSTLGNGSLRSAYLALPTARSCGTIQLSHNRSFLLPPFFRLSLAEKENKNKIHCLLSHCPTTSRAQDIPNLQRPHCSAHRRYNFRGFGSAHCHREGLAISLLYAIARPSPEKNKENNNKIKEEFSIFLGLKPSALKTFA